MIVELGSATRSTAIRVRIQAKRPLRGVEIPPNPPLIKGGDGGLFTSLVKTFRIISLDTASDRRATPPYVP